MSILLMCLFRALHIIAAVTLMGGAIFHRFALLPAAQTLSPEAHDQLRGQLRPLWAKLVMMSISMLLVSGLTAFVNNVVVYQFDKTQTLGKLYHMLFGVKFMLALVVFFLASLLSGKSEAAEKVRANAKFWLNVNLTLATVIIVLGGMMRFADRAPKATITSQAPADVEATVAGVQPAASSETAPTVQ